MRRSHPRELLPSTASRDRRDSVVGGRPDRGQDDSSPSSKRPACGSASRDRSVVVAEWAQAVVTLLGVGLLAALYWVVALVLVVAGVGKLVDPARTGGAMAALGLPAPRFGARVVGAWEVVLGGAALMAPRGGVGTIVAALVAATYLVLALVVAVAIRRGLADCGCIGVRASAPSSLHVALNVGSALVAATVSVFGAADLVSGLEDLGLPWNLLTAVVVAGAAGALVALPGGSAAEQ